MTDQVAWTTRQLRGKKMFAIQWITANSTIFFAGRADHVIVYWGFHTGILTPCIDPTGELGHPNDEAIPDHSVVAVQATKYAFTSLHEGGSLHLWGKHFWGGKLPTTYERLFFSPKLPCGPCDLVSHSKWERQKLTIFMNLGEARFAGETVRQNYLLRSRITKSNKNKTQHDQGKVRHGTQAPPGQEPGARPIRGWRVPRKCNPHTVHLQPCSKIKLYELGAAQKLEGMLQEYNKSYGESNGFKPTTCHSLP